MCSQVRIQGPAVHATWSVLVISVQPLFNSVIIAPLNNITTYSKMQWCAVHEK